jgi:tetratricopeptide (TPR) repeat protein
VAREAQESFVLMTSIIATLIVALSIGLLGAGLFISQRRLRRAGLPGLSAVLVRNARAVSSEKNGETVIHLEGQPEGLALNSVAGKCWELSDGTRTVFQIARIVGSNYNVTLGRALREVRAFSRRLKLALLALEPHEWDLLHVHHDDLFVGTKSPGVVEVTLESGLIVHAAACLQGADGTLRPWRGTRAERRAGNEAMRAHQKDEAPRESAARQFRKAWDCCVAGRLEMARVTFLKCAEATPDWANAWYQVGYVELRMKRYADAINSLQKAEKLSPGLFMVREYLDQALRLAAGNLSHEAFLLLDKATAAGLKEPESIIRLARKALRISPEFPSARLVLARAYEKKELFQMALEQLSHTIKMNPDPATLCHALLSRGSIFQAQGRPEMALREWEKVIELNGSSSATRSALESLTTAGSVH